MNGRDEVGLVLEEGKNIGSAATTYCVGVYLPSAGEVVCPEKRREQDVVATLTSD
jgi:hypothetical protein